jgi:hypothetical protein
VAATTARAKLLAPSFLAPLVWRRVEAEPPASEALTLPVADPPDAPEAPEVSDTPDAPALAPEPLPEPLAPEAPVELLLVALALVRDFASNSKAQAVYQ